MVRIWRQIRLFMLLAVMMAAAFPQFASARISVARAYFSQTSFLPGSENDVTIQVVNVSGPVMVWIQVVRPSPDYVIVGADLPGWQATVTSNQVIFSGGHVGGDGAVFPHITVRARSWESAPLAWTVRASDSSNGASPTDCSGGLNTSIQVEKMPENAGLGVSDVAIVPGASTAFISWQSDTPTGSGVGFGVTDEYGRGSVYDPVLTTSHRVVIDGLDAETAYHLQVGGLDGAGVAYYSGDNTFTTVTAPPPFQPEISPGEGTSAESRGVAAGTAQSGDKEPPRVVVIQRPSGVYRAAPEVRGWASDNVTVVTVEYSTDNAKNWVKAGIEEGTGPKGQQRVNWSFTPAQPEDGDYDLLVRAQDEAGNSAIATAGTLIIDRLPPRIGGAALSLGAQVQPPDEQGAWNGLVGVEQRVTLAALGGPVRMQIQAQRDGFKRSDQLFLMRRDNVTGLWSGVLGFQLAGRYRLNMVAIDGAGNRIEQALPTMEVLPKPRVTTENGAPLAGATVALYYRDLATSSWQLWDGAAYGQNNPQQTDRNGGFELVPPAGDYYLEVRAPGYRPKVSDQIHWPALAPMSSNVAVRPRLALHAWRLHLELPLVMSDHFKLTSEAVRQLGAASGAVLPTTEWQTAARSRFASVDLLGRPFVVGYVASWLPDASGTLEYLARLRHELPAPVVAAVEAESQRGVQALVSRGAYDVPIVVDSDAVLGRTFGAPALPQLMVFDRTGRLRLYLPLGASAEEVRQALEQISL